MTDNAADEKRDQPDDQTVLASEFDAHRICQLADTSATLPPDPFTARFANELPSDFFPNHLPAGYQIDDFRIVATLGRGAFACVYLAQQVSMRRLVALKISLGLANTPDEVGESQTLARLDHPGIVRVFDQRRLEDRDIHLLYMQYLPGGTLSGVVDRVREHYRSHRNGSSAGSRLGIAAAMEPHGRILLESVDEHLLSASQQVPEHSNVRDWISQASWSMVVAWVGVQLARALHEAHSQGVLHRDVKPANVLLSAEGKPRLADFNVSFMAPQPSQTQTSPEDELVSDSIGGSIAYMAPEQLRAVADVLGSRLPPQRTPPSSQGATPSSESGSKSVPSSAQIGARADIYSMGVLLWELWLGSRPFQDEPPPLSAEGWFAKQIEYRRQTPGAIAGIRSGSQRVLEKVLRQCVASDPRDRPRTAEELGARLRLALYPDAAKLFDPSETSWPSRCGRITPWLVAATFILLPNIAAGFFNFAYNDAEIIGRHPELRPRFVSLANTVNWIAFPLGLVLMIAIARPVAAAIANARRGRASDRLAITQTVQLGRHAAWIGGVLWLTAAVVFPLALVTGSPSLPTVEALHFFGSLVICGGVAAVYPFFGLIVMTTRVYYPCLIRTSMRDDDFDRRHDEVRRWCGRFLLGAAGIPLLGLALLLSRDAMAKHVVASAVGATAIGLVAAFAAFQCVHAHWETMSEILSSRKQSAGQIGGERFDG